jgi:hypothetical protein
MPMRAQEATSRYRLRVPDAAEYLRAVPELLKSDVPDVESVLKTELRIRYPDFAQQNFELVDGAYRRLKDRIWGDEADKKLWLAARAISWLTTFKINLDGLNSFTFAGVNIPVTAFDLDGDRQKEWILDFQANEVQGYVVLRRDTNGQYQHIPNPLPITQLRLDPIWERPYAQFRTVHLGDINADHLPEMIVLVQNSDPNSDATYGRYYILSWRNNALVDIGEKGLSFYEQDLRTEWELAAAKANAALEIRQMRGMKDNWGCSWQQVATFAWDQVM